MKIEKILPCGFCYGVMYSYQQSLEIIKNHPYHKIYMLGWLVHNIHVINELQQLGVIILDDKLTDRFEIINKLEIKKDEPSILILSAHGTDFKTIELAKQNGLEVYDLTCKFVYKTHDIIKQKLSQSYEVIFVGKNNHPETKAILAINSKILLVSSIDDVKKLTFDHNKKYFCTNQTTFNMLELDTIVDKIRTNISDIEFANDICNATRMRQQSVLSMPKEVDICLILGDKSSSNANELFKIAKSRTTTYMINDHKDIQTQWFEDKKYCTIAAAASTPSSLIEEVYTFLCEKFK